jgi:hypothetical protein
MSDPDYVEELHRQIGESSMRAMDVMDGETIMVLAYVQGALQRLTDHLRGRGLGTDQIVSLAVGVAIQAAFTDVEEA